MEFNVDAATEAPLRQTDLPYEIKPFDIDLGVVVESEDQFRFNQDGVYIARETAVLLRCSIVEKVHGQLATDDDTPCSLLVFDFQFDRIRNGHSIKEVTINLIFHGVKARRISPEEKISFNPVVQLEERTQGKNIKGGLTYVGSVEAGVSDESKIITENTEYATATGWTSYWPRPRHNDPSPHNCVRWFIEENKAGKGGVPAHFRAAVLLERIDPDDGEDNIRLEMEIESKADRWTEIGDRMLQLLRGRVPPGKLDIDTTLPPTNYLHGYTSDVIQELGRLNLEEFGKLSFGKLQQDQFR